MAATLLLSLLLLLLCHTSPYTIDLLLPQSSELQRAAAALAVADLQADNVLDPSKLSFRYTETNCSSSHIVDVIRTLQLDHPSDAVLGPVCDGECVVSWPYLEHQKILQIAYSCGDVRDDWADGDSGFSRTIRMANQQAEKIPALVATLKKFEWTKIAFLRPLDRPEWDAFSGKMTTAFSSGGIDSQTFVYRATAESVNEVLQHAASQGRYTIVFAGNALENSFVVSEAGNLEPFKWAFIGLNIHKDDTMMATLESDDVLDVKPKYLSGFLGIEQSECAIGRCGNYSARVLERVNKTHVYESVLDDSRLVYDSVYALGQMLATYEKNGGHEATIGASDVSALIQAIDFHGSSGLVRFTAPQLRVPTLELINYQYLLQAKTLARVVVGKFDSNRTTLDLNPGSKIYWHGGSKTIPNTSGSTEHIQVVSNSRLMSGIFSLLLAATIVGAIWSLLSHSEENMASYDARKVSRHLSDIDDPEEVKLKLCATVEKQNTLHREMFFLFVHASFDAINTVFALACFVVVLLTVDDSEWYLVIYAVLCGVDLAFLPIASLPWAKLFSQRRLEYLGTCEPAANGGANVKLMTNSKRIVPKTDATSKLRNKTPVSEASVISLKLQGIQRERGNVVLSLYKCVFQQLPLLICTLAYAYRFHDQSYGGALFLVASASSSLALGFKCHLIDRYVRLRTEYNIQTYELALLTMLSNQRRSSYN